MAGALRELIELLLTEIAISGTDGKNCLPILLPYSHAGCPPACYGKYHVSLRPH
jgi:hypothetical protein